MCQFNYTIVKNKKSVSYLSKLGYGCFKIYPGGYKAFGGNRPGFCDCGSMVGSQSLAFKEEGKYPFQLCANDYWRAVKIQADFFDEVQKRRQSPDFKAELQEFEDAFAPINERLTELWEKQYSSPDALGDPDTSCFAKDSCFAEEKNALLKQQETLFASKDAAFLEARTAVFLEENLPYKRVAPEINKYKSCNYNMQEFRYYRRIFQRLLEFEPYICFTHIFDQPGELTLVKTLRLNELHIGDLAMLAQDDVIRILR